VEQPAHGFIYKVPHRRGTQELQDTFTEVFVRNRVYSLEMDANEFRDEDKADAYLSVTDSFVAAPKDKPFVWVPWNESRKPHPELYYATNKMLNWWINYQRLPRIQVFCDGGSHRSVTIFGAYLRTYYKSYEADKIVAERVTVDPWSDVPKGYDHTKISQPLEYIDGYLEEFPADRLLFKAMGNDWLGRLEGFSQDIYELVKKRYAKHDGLGL
jgi:hypothetical protein